MKTAYLIRDERDRRLLYSLSDCKETENEVCRKYQYLKLSFFTYIL